MNTLRLFTPSVFRTLPYDLFENFLSDSLNESNSVYPNTNILEEDDKFRIEMALPGYTKEQINMTHLKNVLTVKSDIDENSSDDRKFLTREFRMRNFTKQFALPHTLNVEGISAEFSDGILTITIPKKEEARIKQPVQIQIQ